MPVAEEPEGGKVFFVEEYIFAHICIRCDLGLIRWCLVSSEALLLAGGFGCSRWFFMLVRHGADDVLKELKI